MDNRVIIIDWMSPYIRYGGYTDAHKVEFSPGTKKYAVIELIESKVFVSVLVREVTENGLVGVYRDSFEEKQWIDSNNKYITDWSPLDYYGYVNLMCKRNDKKGFVVKEKLWCDKTMI